MLRMLAAAALLLVTWISAPGAAQARRPVSALRLYVFDCGTLDVADTGRFRLKREEVATDKLSVGCYLVVHPRGTLIWDTGAVPDAMVTAGPVPVRYRLLLPDAQERNVAIARPLKAQLAEAGSRPADITYVALSHYHDDHSANT